LSLRLGQEIQALSRRSTASERLTIHVAAAAVLDARGRVLIAQRPAGKHLAGMWEFPGGKVEPGEARVDALRRELEEEIGISIGMPRPLLRLRHAYSYGEVLLDVWVVRHYRGEPRSLDGQALRWCSRASLGTAELLPADRPIIGALRLPERLRVRDTPHYHIHEFSAFRARRPEGTPALRGVSCGSVDQARAAVKGGAGFVALRERLGEAEITGLCESVPVPVFARGLSLARAWELGASGVNALG
jgi:mutator protein MutT